MVTSAGESIEGEVLDEVNVICQVRPSVSLFEIDDAIHLMDSGSKPMSGDMLCFELYGERAVGKLMGNQSSPVAANRWRGLLWRI